MRLLPRSEGFPQHHAGVLHATKYLRNILPENLKYHRSAVTLSLIRSDLMQFRNHTKMPEDLLLKLAVIQTRKDFSLSGSVPMIHLNDVFRKELNIWSSSPGLPWMKQGYATKREIAKDPDAVQRVRWFWHRVKNGDKMAPPDSLAYVRSHLAEEGEEKVRAIWGYPATITFGEAVFALPLIEAYSVKTNKSIAYGYEPGIGGFKRLFNRFGNGKYFQTLDFSKFDKTVPAWLIRLAFDILKDNIDFIHYKDYGVANVRNNLIMWDYIVDYFINTPIRLCNGERFKKSSGVASGSYFTQLIDSVVNGILINWIMLTFQGKFPVDYVVMGDDSLISSYNSIDFDDINDLLSTIGMKLNIINT